MKAAIDLCELAWGSQRGYVSLSVRDPSLDKSEKGYWVDKMYAWPDQREDIDKVLTKAKTSSRDVYWAPAVFSFRSRAKEGVTALHALWADLDEVKPEQIPAMFKPTAIWESSPGRYQALWKLKRSLNAEEHQRLNRRLTYALGADKGGWDLTQVLRTPGTHNHKYTDHPEVKLLHLNGHRLDPDDALEDLPELDLPAPVTDTTLPDAKSVLKTYSSTFSGRVKQLLRAKHATVGERSERLWELECLLAERGLEANEIASVVRASVWNKFRGRKDEISRLLVEAEKALRHAGPSEDVLEALEDDDDEILPVKWDEFDHSHKAIRWLVADVWGENEVGFISGLPKSYKSWLALDLAVSVSTGTRFLNSFQTHRNPVLLIQEEDPKPVLQDRLVKIAAAKGLIEVERVGDEIEMKYDLPDNLHIISNQGFTLSEEWLEQAEHWIIERQIKLCILDPLMMIASGTFDEFKAFEFMTKVLKPLKRLRARTQTAIVLVHHHLKGSVTGGARDMYGSVALWAWEESALHLQIPSAGKVTAERFSKHSLLDPMTIDIGDVTEEWKPTVTMGAPVHSDVIELLRGMEAGATTEELISVGHWSRAVVKKQLREAEKLGAIVKIGTEKPGSEGGRPRDIWQVS